MKRKVIFILFAFIFGWSLFVWFSIWLDKKIGWDYSIRDKLKNLKQTGLIMDYDNFHWEYDYKSIASFDIKFINGKTGVFNYAKLEDGKIMFESMGGYDGYAIGGYMKYKDGRGVTNVCGYYKLLNFYTVEDVIENLSAIDKVIEEMPVIKQKSPVDIYKEDFRQKIPDNVRYEDDEVEIIFYRVKSKD